MTIGGHGWPIALENSRLLRSWLLNVYEVPCFLLEEMFFLIWFLCEPEPPFYCDEEVLFFFIMFKLEVLSMKLFWAFES